MTIRHMRIFLTVCNCDNHVTQAAAALYMSQPSVTLAIKELETYYDVKLFDRISRRLYLTEAGKEFREYAGRILAQYDDMENRMQSWKESGKIRIGASMTIGSEMVPGYVSAYQKAHPQTEVSVRIEPSRLLEEKLMQNELDLALVETDTHLPGLKTETYMEDELVVIVPASDPYRDQMVFTPEDIKQEKFVLREKGSGTRNLFDQVMEENYISINPIWEVESTSALISAVSHGIGISVVPRLTAMRAGTDGKVFIAGIRGIRFIQHFSIARHQDKWITPALRDFVDIVRGSTEEGK